jgi:hypothetical protein
VIHACSACHRAERDVTIAANFRWASRPSEPHDPLAASLPRHQADSVVRSPERVSRTPWSAALVPNPTVLLGALASALLTALLLLITWSLLDPRDERMDRYGKATVAALGDLCMEPLLKQDLLHLGVIGNRMVELDEIAGVATYTSDEQLLTLTGKLEGPEYRRAINIEGSVVGHVRLALDPDAFDGSITDPAKRSTLLTATLVIVAGAALLVAMLASVLREWRAGRLELRAPDIGAHIRRVRAGAPVLEEIEEEPEPEPEPPEPIRHYLLGVNLYNQLSLKGVEREFELSLCTELAEAVALRYQGQVVSLPGLGALVDFDHTDTEDRTFEIVCAGFALSRLLGDEAPFGHYRLALHLATRPGDEPLPLDHPAVRDVALLSALAKDDTLAISETLYEALEGTDRLETRSMSNVLLDELTTSGPGCRIVTDLEAAAKTGVLQLVDSLKTQRDSIASESTF